MQDEIKQKDERIEFYDRKISEMETFYAKENDTREERYKNHLNSTP